MNHCCLHVEVSLNVSPEAWLSLCESAVPVMRRLPGLVWKLWVLDREQGTAGGVYLFRDVDAARAYEAGPELAGLRAAGVARSIVTRLLPLQDSLSRQTFGLGVAPSGPRAEAAEAEVNVARSAAGSS